MTIQHVYRATYFDTNEGARMSKTLLTTSSMLILYCTCTAEKHYECNGSRRILCNATPSRKRAYQCALIAVSGCILAIISSFVIKWSILSNRPSKLFILPPIELGLAWPKSE